MNYIMKVFDVDYVQLITDVAVKCYQFVKKHPVYVVLSLAYIPFGVWLWINIYNNDVQFHNQAGTIISTSFGLFVLSGIYYIGLNSMHWGAYHDNNNGDAP